MSSELLVGGDAAPHRHDLPEVPVEKRTSRVIGPRNSDGTQYQGWRTEQIELENAVARCSGCGGLFVSREDPNGWGRVVYWTRLRWWHRTARRKLRGLRGDGHVCAPHCEHCQCRKCLY